jgi:hypothetical protein
MKAEGRIENLESGYFLLGGTQGEFLSGGV